MQKLADLLVSLPGASPPAFMWRTIVVKRKKRHIGEPNESMRALHERLIRRLRGLATLQRMESAYGVVGGRSNMDNARAHILNRYFYQLDVRGAFQSVSLERLAEALCMLDNSLGTVREAKEFLARYCGGQRGGLVTGGPASPFLFDLYCAVFLDLVIRKLCPWVCNTYTRYLDDITISSKRPIPSILRRRIRQAVIDAGLEVSHHKSSLTDRQKQAVTITGVRITRTGEMKPTETHLARIVALLRQPPQSATAHDARVLSGYAGILEQFRSDARGELPWYSISPEVGALAKRVHARLRRYSSAGLLAPDCRQEKVKDARIPQEFLNYLLVKVPVEEVAGWYVHLKKRRSSKEYRGLSPFNKEKTPSFTVAPHKKMFFDFSAGIHGDIFEMVMRMERLSFPTAVKKIAEQYGIPMPKTGP